MKAFIVDDSYLMRERLKEMLSDASVELSGEADCSKEGLEGICKTFPDLVILDIRMKGGSGITIIEKIKALPKDMKIMVLTNYPFPQYKQKCEELGADYFFDKSSDFDLLHHTIKELASRGAGRFACKESD